MKEAKRGLLTEKQTVVSRINVPPGDKVSSSSLSRLMKKLNGRKIRWICREFEKGRLSICR
ncbi:MAG: hypothetical protein V3R82_07250, partial [Candidatus Hydrothermarchaeales archaeon]